MRQIKSLISSKKKKAPMSSTDGLKVFFPDVGHPIEFKLDQSIRVLHEWRENMTTEEDTKCLVGELQLKA